MLEVREGVSGLETVEVAKRNRWGLSTARTPGDGHQMFMFHLYE